MSTNAPASNGAATSADASANPAANAAATAPKPARRPVVAITVNVPFAPGSVPGCGTVVEEGDRQAYLEALEREAVASRGDAQDRSVARLTFVGGTAANMRLDAWCRLMEKLRQSYRGVEMAFLRFDVAPDLVSQKTAAYAFKYKCLFDLVLGTMDGTAAGQVATAAEVLGRERIASWGVTLPPLPADTSDEGAEGTGRTLPEAAVKAFDAILDCKPGFVRVDETDVTDDTGEATGLPAQLAEQLAERGYTERIPGFYALLPRYQAWFANEGGLELGFGLGSVSTFPEGTMVTTQDPKAYIRKAGVASDIYALRNR